jgi:NTP pyrophosphatase (non-canonical NTP hydrolase)
MINEAQRELQKIADQYDDFYWKPHEILTRVTEEVGELARLINHQFGPKKKKLTEAEQNMGEEIADILFALFCLANSLNIELDSHFKKVLDKFYIRKDEIRLGAKRKIAKK